MQRYMVKLPKVGRYVLLLSIKADHHGNVIFADTNVCNSKPSLVRVEDLGSKDSSEERIPQREDLPWLARNVVQDSLQ